MSTQKATALLALVCGLAGCASAPKTPVFGTWKITSYSTPGMQAGQAPVPTLAYIGLSASFEEKDARFGGDRCGSPSYIASTLSTAEFQQQFKVTPTALGLTDPVNVVQVKCGVDWNSHASSLIVKAPGLLVAPVDGTFFEMVKR